jgi:3D (Asp-Asp-Asp) domain-containing protein
MFCIGLGFVVIAGMIDLAQSEHDRKKVFGEHDGSLETKNDVRESHSIRAESNAGADKKEKRRMIREVSAYNSVPEQTDSTPCISADGTDICKRHKKGECIVASNAYPLNTRLRIENIGDCIVADRTHPRFRHRVDLFMDKDVRGAKNFGVRKLTIAELEDDDGGV